MTITLFKTYVDECGNIMNNRAYAVGQTRKLLKDNVRLATLCVPDGASITIQGVAEDANGVFGLQYIRTQYGASINSDYNYLEKRSCQNCIECGHCVPHKYSNDLMACMCDCYKESEE